MPVLIKNTLLRPLQSTEPSTESGSYRPKSTLVIPWRSTLRYQLRTNNHNKENSMQSLAPRLSSLGFMLLLAAGSAATQAAQWQVSGHGLDTDACNSSAPCRSISEAIRRARAGDTIVVLPGLYGDLNRDGVLAGP